MNKIQKEQSSFIDKLRLQNIPTSSCQGKTDFTQFTEYLNNQNDDYVNAIFYLLRSNNFSRPIKIEDSKNPIDCAFQDFFDDINRKVVFFSSQQHPDPFFIIKPNSNIYPFFYPLIKWKPSMAHVKKPIGQYMTNPQNFFIYCCHFFRDMISNSFSQLDLNEWCLSSEIPNASDIISDIILDASDVQSYFEPELGCLLMIISKFQYRPLNDKFTTPYIFENGFCVKVRREQNLFSYQMKYHDHFLIESTNDSICFQPDESLCIHLNFPFEICVVFNSQSILFDGEKLFLIEKGERVTYITNDGVFVSQINGPIIINQYGTISQKKDGKWNSVTSNSTTFIDGKKANLKSSYTINYSTGTKSMIRPDQIEYYINQNGTRRILFNDGISIEQKSNINITYDVPDFPLIQFNEGSFNIHMNSLSFTFSNNKTVSIKSDLFTSNFDGEKLVINMSDINIELKQNECNVKSQTTSLHADSVNSNNKFESTTPQSEIEKKYPIRFFAIRNDFSGVEFVRKDSELLKDAVFQSNKIPHPYGGQVTVLEAHFKDIEKDPFIFIENEPLKLPDDENELKKVFEGNDEVVDIENDRKTFSSDNVIFARIIENFLENENENFHANFLDFNNLNEDVQLPMPVPTPPPRLQKMQYNLYQDKVKDLGFGCVLNYFKSHQADFVIIDNEYEIIEEEEEEEEHVIENMVNFKLKQYEISGADIDYSGQNVINDLPPPPRSQANDFK